MANVVVIFFPLEVIPRLWTVKTNIRKKNPMSLRLTGTSAGPRRRRAERAGATKKKKQKTTQTAQTSYSSGWVGGDFFFPSDVLWFVLRLCFRMYSRYRTAVRPGDGYTSHIEPDVYFSRKLIEPYVYFPRKLIEPDVELYFARRISLSFGVEF